jgi:hypothetical protein
MWPSTTGEFALFLILLVGGALIVSTLAGTAAALVAVRVVGPRESRWFGPPATFAGIAVFAAVIDGRGSIAIVAILALSVAVLVTLVGRLGWGCESTGPGGHGRCRPVDRPGGHHRRAPAAGWSSGLTGRAPREQQLPLTLSGGQ